MLPEEEKALVEFADSETHWMPFGQRKRRLPYGFVYGVSSRSIIGVAPPIPPILEGLAQRLVDAQIITKRAEQIVFQDYGAGTGFGEHVDAPVFGPEVCSISLLSRCVCPFVTRCGRKFFAKSWNQGASLR